MKHTLIIAAAILVGFLAVANSIEKASHNMRYSVVSDTLGPMIDHETGTAYMPERQEQSLPGLPGTFTWRPFVFLGSAPLKK
jgi:hypothetical protein